MLLTCGGVIGFEEFVVDGGESCRLVSLGGSRDLLCKGGVGVEESEFV